MSAELLFQGEIKELNALPKAQKVFPRLGEVPSQVLQIHLTRQFPAIRGCCVWQNLKIGKDSGLGGISQSFQ